MVVIWNISLKDIKRAIYSKRGIQSVKGIIRSYKNLRKHEYIIFMYAVLANRFDVVKVLIEELNFSNFISANFLIEKSLENKNTELAIYLYNKFKREINKTGLSPMVSNFILGLMI